MSCYDSACLCLVLIGCLFILVATLDNDEEEVAFAGFYWRKIGLSYIAQDQGQTRTKESHPKCLRPYYLSLSIMHVLLLKVLQNKNIFLCEYYYY